MPPPTACIFAASGAATPFKAFLFRIVFRGFAEFSWPGRRRLKRLALQSPQAPGITPMTVPIIARTLIINPFQFFYHFNIGNFWRKFINILWFRNKGFLSVTNNLANGQIIDQGRNKRKKNHSPNFRPSQCKPGKKPVKRVYHLRLLIINPKKGCNLIPWSNFRMEKWRNNCLVL